MSGTPILIVGLGNPGPKYTNTRHNAGFDVVDELSRRWGLSAFQMKFKAELAESTSLGRKVFLLKPQTYMNLSGQSVAEVVNFYKIPLDQVVLISDDVDLPAGDLRLRLQGGSGGHNGLKSVIESLGSEAFARVRVGVGRSPILSAADYVLQKIPATELASYRTTIVTAADSVECLIKEGMLKAMNAFNQKKEKS